MKTEKIEIRRKKKKNSESWKFTDATPIATRKRRIYDKCVAITKARKARWNTITTNKKKKKLRWASSNKTKPFLQWKN